MPIDFAPKTNPHDWAMLRPQLLFAFDEPIPADISGRWTRRKEFSAWLLRKGQATVTVEGKTFVCGPGKWLIVHADEIEQEFSPGAHLLSLRVAQSWPNGSTLFTDSVQTLSARQHPKLEKLALPLLRYMRTQVPWHKQAEDQRGTFLRKTQMTYFEFIECERRFLAWLKQLALALSENGAVMHLPESTGARIAKVLQIMDLVPPGSPFPKKTDPSGRWPLHGPAQSTMSGSIRPHALPTLGKPACGLGVPNAFDPVRAHQRSCPRIGVQRTVVLLCMV